MKTIKIICISILLLGTSLLTNAQDSNITKEFNVFGNCGMCESRIEKAAKSVEGVINADWNEETKMISVSLDSNKTDVHKIQMAIAKAGHDTEMHKADNKTYEKLPGCCQYERSTIKMDMDHKGGCKGKKGGC